MNIKSTRNVLTTTALAAALVIPTVTPAFEASAATTQSAKKLKVSAVLSESDLDTGAKINSAIDDLKIDTDYVKNVGIIRTALTGLKATAKKDSADETKYVEGYETDAKATATEKAVVTGENGKLADLVTAEANVKLITAATTKINAIATVTDATKYKTTVDAAETAYIALKEVGTAKTDLQPTLSNLKDTLDTATANVDLIDTFITKYKAIDATANTFVAKVEEADVAYTAFDGVKITLKTTTGTKDEGIVKAIPTEDNKFSNATTGYKKQAEIVTELIEEIKDLKPTTLATDYVTTVNEVNTKYTNLSKTNGLSAANAQKNITNYSDLTTAITNVKKVTDLQTAIAALKLGTGYVAAVTKVDGTYTNAEFKGKLDAAVAATSVTALDTAKGYKEKIEELEKDIDDLLNTKTSYLDDVKAANDKYTASTFSTLKTSVSAASVTTLTKHIADAKKVTDLEAAITAISSNKTSYLTDIAAALKTYNALDTNLKALVSNKENLTKTDSTTSYEALAKQVTDFDATVKALSSANSTYLADVTAAEGKLEELKEANLDKFATASKKALTAHSNDAKTVKELITLVGSTSEALSTSNSTYVADVAKALKTYNALSTNLKALVTGNASLTAAGSTTSHEAVAKSITTLITDIKALKPTDTKFFVNYTKVATSYNKLLNSASTKTDTLEATTDDNKNLVALVTNASTLADYATAVAAVKDGSTKAYDLINALSANSDSDTIKTARTAYDALDKNLQKYVTNYKTLTTQEARVKGANAVLTSLEAINTPAKINEKTFVADAKKLKAAYDKLTSAEKTLVGTTKGDLITSIAAQAKVYEKISKIKSSSSKFVAEIYAAKKDFLLLDAADADAVAAIKDEVVKSKTTTYSETDKVTYVKNIAVIKDGEKAMEKAVDMIADIDGLKAYDADDKISEKIAKIKTVKDDFNKLDPQVKKYVTNAKVLTAAEKSVKNAVAAKTLIDKIPTSAPETTDKSFAGLVTKAEKAVKKLSANELKLIGEAEKTKVESMAKQAAVFTKIAKLKPSAKYIEQVEAAQKDLDALPTLADGATDYLVKAKLTLQTAQNAIVDPKEAIKKIKVLETTPYTLQQVKDATADFDKLDANGKKYVTNAKLLTNAQKQLKAAQKIDALILTVKDLDASSKSYAAKKASLTKAYNKLTDQQKALLEKADDYTSLPEATTATK